VYLGPYKAQFGELAVRLTEIARPSSDRYSAGVSFVFVQVIRCQREAESHHETARDMLDYRKMTAVYRN